MTDATDAAAATDATDAAADASAASAVRVVIAEDEAIIRLDLAEMLAEEGYEVVGETGRGDDAVDLVRALEPDLAILDVKMPGMDGLRAAALIAEQPGCGVIMLTAFSQREMIAAAGEAGVLAYLVKPFQKAELVAAIEVALARDRERQQLRGTVRSLEERLETRKWIDRAKGRLIDHGMTEAEAFSHLQRKSMDQRTTMRAVAEAILSD